MRVEINVPDIVVMRVNLHHLLGGLSLIPQPDHPVMRSGELELTDLVEGDAVGLLLREDHCGLGGVSDVPETDFVIGTCTQEVGILGTPVHAGLVG